MLTEAKISPLVVSTRLVRALTLGLVGREDTEGMAPSLDLWTPVLRRLYPCCEYHV